MYKRVPLHCTEDVCCRCPRKKRKQIYSRIRQQFKLYTGGGHLEYHDLQRREPENICSIHHFPRKLSRQNEFEHQWLVSEERGGGGEGVFVVSPLRCETLDLKQPVGAEGLWTSSLWFVVLPFFK